MNTENLKIARKKANMKQKDVSDALGISPNTYKNYEQGLREPNGDMIVKLANLLGVTTDYLLGRDSENIDHIDELPIGVHDKAIMQAYINLPQEDRTKLVEILRKIADGADLEVTVNDGIQKTVYAPSNQAPMVARSDKPPNQYTSEQDAQLLSEPGHPEKF